MLNPLLIVLLALAWRTVIVTAVIDARSSSSSALDLHRTVPGNDRPFTEGKVKIGRFGSPSKRRSLKFNVRLLPVVQCGETMPTNGSGDILEDS